MLTIRIGQLPGRITELALENGSKVNTALETAELNPEGFEVRVNGGLADGDTVLADGDTVLLVRKIRGNTDHIMVRVGQLPGRIIEIALNGDRTVNMALETAELNPEGFEVRVNGALADGNTVLADGDTTLLVRKIRGN